MDREHRLEYLLRKALNCDRPEQLLTFAGFANAGALNLEGNFYIGVLSSLGAIYPTSSLEKCNEIDTFIEDLSIYRDIRLNDIPDAEYSVIFEILKNIINN